MGGMLGSIGTLMKKDSNSNPSNMIDISVPALIACFGQKA
jgi:hypothetical protein